MGPQLPNQPTELFKHLFDSFEKFHFLTRWSNPICKFVSHKHYGLSKLANIYRKYEHSKTFGLITSTSSNVVWARSENVQNTSLRSSAAGTAIVGADEEVLCWDIKKGELLSRWKDNSCNAEVTTITQSRTDPDIYAVGLVGSAHRNRSLFIC